LNFGFTSLFNQVTSESGKFFQGETVNIFLGNKVKFSKT